MSVRNPLGPRGWRTGDYRDGPDRGLPVNWETLDAKRVEDLVSSLLNVLYPGRAQRIDGIGGDDGQDVQLRLGDEVHVFEIKSHTGQIRPNRGAQPGSGRSARRAARGMPMGRGSA